MNVLRLDSLKQSEELPMNAKNLFVHKVGNLETESGIENRRSQSKILKSDFMDRY